MEGKGKKECKVEEKEEKVVVNDNETRKKNRRKGVRSRITVGCWRLNFRQARFHVSIGRFGCNASRVPLLQ
jgi:hypothetical protein